MTHEEIAEQIYKEKIGIHSNWYAITQAIASALASAEKKGRDGIYKIPCECGKEVEFHFGFPNKAYEKGWNEAISAAVKVAEEKGEVMAKIEKLKEDPDPALDPNKNHQVVITQAQVRDLTLKVNELIDEIEELKDAQAVVKTPGARSRRTSMS